MNICKSLCILLLSLSLASVKGQGIFLSEKDSSTYSATFYPLNRSIALRKAIKPNRFAGIRIEQVRRIRDFAEIDIDAGMLFPDIFIDHPDEFFLNGIKLSPEWALFNRRGGDFIGEYLALSLNCLWAKHKFWYRQPDTEENLTHNAYIAGLGGTARFGKQNSLGDFLLLDYFLDLDFNVAFVYKRNFQAPYANEVLMNSLDLWEPYFPNTTPYLNLKVGLGIGFRERPDKVRQQIAMLPKLKYNSAIKLKVGGKFNNIGIQYERFLTPRHSIEFTYTNNLIDLKREERLSYNNIKGHHIIRTTYSKHNGTIFFKQYFNHDGYGRGKGFYASLGVLGGRDHQHVIYDSISAPIRKQFSYKQWINFGGLGFGTGVPLYLFKRLSLEPQVAICYNFYNHDTPYESNFRPKSMMPGFERWERAYPKYEFLFNLSVGLLLEAPKKGG